jgi:flagellar basal body rod protein FlgG
MANGIYIAVSGATSRLQQLDVLANNLANATTTGFKRDEVSFHSVTGGQAKGAPSGGNADIKDRQFVQVHESRPFLGQGELLRTDNPLDVAIQGDAFFKVDADGEERLTRDGRLLISADGILRTLNGNTILDDQGGAIYLPPEHVPRIDNEGRIFSDKVEVARLALVGLGETAQLRRDGSNLFIPPEDSEVLPLGSGVEVQQGWIEGSNARPVEMFVDLISVQRAHAALHRAITAYKEMDRSAIRVAR